VEPGGHAAATTTQPYREPLRSDAFTAEATAVELAPRWHWQANPQPSWARSGDGRLDLAFAPSPRGDLRALGPLLAPQLPGQPATWTVSLELPAAPAGDRIGAERAGLTVLGLSYAWVGLRRLDGRVELVHGTMAQDEVGEAVTVHRLLTDDPGASVSVQLR